MAVSWVWSGAVTDSGFSVTAALDASATACRLAVSDDPALVSPVYSDPASPDSDNYVQLNIAGLDPLTQYYYQIEIDSTLDSDLTGQVRTFPLGGTPASFMFAFSSCNTTGSNHKVFKQIGSKRPLFFFHLGDKHYANISTNDPTLYLAAHESNFAAANQLLLHKMVPVVYVWDDHDFGVDNSDGTSAAKPAAASTYRQIVPSYPLTAPDSINHVFDVGSVRFIVTDLRYFRSADSVADSSSKTMLGSTQKAWFESQLDAATEDAVDLVVWANTQQWTINRSTLDSDYWGAFSSERRELTEYMEAIGAPPVLIISGDAHELAATGSYVLSGRRFIVLQSAALDQTSITRGGVWDAGPSGGGDRYSTLNIDFAGGSLDKVRWNAFIVDNSTGNETLRYSLEYRFGLRDLKSPMGDIESVRVGDGLMHGG